jgi:cytosine/uracil/thiamine/allantoin permease
VDIPYASPILNSEDSAPIVDRKSGAPGIFNVRTSDVPTPRSYCLTARLFLLCGGFLNCIVALGTGVVFSSVPPNFSNVLPPWWGVYGWFFALAIAGALYFVLAAMVPTPVPQTA